MQLLIEAVSNRELEAVISILEDSSHNIDINQIFHNEDQQKFTPLSLAANVSTILVVKELLARGARVEGLASSGLLCWDCTTNALVAYSIREKKRNPEIFKLLLQKAKYINPTFEGWGRGCDSVLKFNDLKNKIDRQEVLKYLFLEAVLRNNTEVINETYKLNQELTSALESMQLYIVDRVIDTQLAFSAYKGIDYLVEQKFILNQRANELKAIVSPSCGFAIEIDSFPEALKKDLVKPSDSSLNEQFARFRYLLCPEENLPPVPIDSISFNNFDTKTFIGSESKEESLNRIRFLQNPVNLEHLLQMDEIQIICRLSVCTELNGTNEAALLLADMLLYKKNEYIKSVDQKKEMPLLSKVFQDKCLKLLVKLYNLTDTEKLMINIHNQNRSEIAELRTENKQIIKKLDNVLDQNKKMFSLLESLQSKKEKLNTNENTIGESKPKKPRFF